jgi:hypothetical protein
MSADVRRPPLVPEAEPGLLGEGTARAHTQCQDDHVGGELPGVGDDRPHGSVAAGQELTHAGLRAYVDAHAAHRVGHLGAELRVERAHRLHGHVDERGAQPPADARLGHLHADVAATDDHRGAWLAPSGQLRQELLSVAEGLDAEDPLGVDARQVRPQRLRARRDHQVVEADALAAGGLHVARGQVDGRGLGAQAYVDAHGPVLLGRARHQVAGESMSPATQ